MKKILSILAGIVFACSVFAQPYIHGVVASSAENGGGIVLDTLGYAIVGSSATGPSDLRAVKFSCSTTGYIDTIYIYHGDELSTDSILVAIYNDDSDYPGDLLGESDIVQSNQDSDMFFPIALQDSVHVYSGRTYYLSFRGNTVHVNYDSGGTRYALTHSWGTPLPDPYTAGAGSAASTFSLFAKIKQK